jgi:hypothetical protein
VASLDRLLQQASQNKGTTATAVAMRAAATLRGDRRTWAGDRRVLPASVERIGGSAPVIARL